MEERNSVRRALGRGTCLPGQRPALNGVVGSPGGIGSDSRGLGRGYRGGIGMEDKGVDGGGGDPRP